MDYAEACRLLFSLPRFDLVGGKAVNPGLAKIRALLADLGSPHTAYPTVHVAGTNGKGSVCSMLAAILTASGKRVGLHTSPHLFSFTERMRIDGQEADEAWVADAVGRIETSIRRVAPSFFEASTALAFLYFAEREVDLAVIEVGMGGRLDATNVIHPEIAVITSISFDHMEQLGTTLPAIAREKAGIIKEGVPVVVGACQPEVESVIESVAETFSAPVVNVCHHPWSAAFDGKKLRLSTPAGDLLPFRLDLPGHHQHRNALTAAATAWHLLPATAYEQDVIRGLSNVRRLSGLRGRCEIIQRDPLVMVDVAHNEDGIRAALECMEREARASTDMYVMLGVAADKDVTAILRIIRRRDCVLMPTAIPGERGLPAADLASIARDVGLRIVEIDSPEAGWDYFRELGDSRRSLLVAGSHYLAGTLPEGLFPRIIRPTGMP